MSKLTFASLDLHLLRIKFNTANVCCHHEASIMSLVVVDASPFSANLAVWDLDVFDLLVNFYVWMSLLKNELSPAGWAPRWAGLAAAPPLLLQKTTKKKKEEKFEWQIEWRFNDMNWNTFIDQVPVFVYFTSHVKQIRPCVTI